MGATPTRPAENVVITTKGLQDRNNILLDGRMENKGKLILTEIFPSVLTILGVTFLSKRAKLNVYNSIIRPVVISNVEKWEEVIKHILLIFQARVLRRIPVCSCKEFNNKACGDMFYIYERKVKSSRPEL